MSLGFCLAARAAAAKVGGDDTKQRLADAFHAHYNLVSENASTDGPGGNEPDHQPL